jgi:hypothetical protein
MVLNSLSSDFASGSAATVGEGGAFCEIGKRGVWSAAAARAAAASVRYVVLALDSAMEESPRWMGGTLRLLATRAHAAVAHGLPRQCYDLERGFMDAFRCLQSGANTGKVVLRVRHGGGIRPAGLHLLSGGSGALGKITSGWLHSNGVHEIVLASRSGKVERADGVPLANGHGGIMGVRCDMAEPVDLRRTLVDVVWRRASHIGGIWHTAGVLSDGLLRSQTAASLRRVYAPKAHGGWGLVRVCATVPMESLVL